MHEMLLGGEIGTRRTETVEFARDQIVVIPIFFAGLRIGNAQIKVTRVFIQLLLRHDGPFEIADRDELTSNRMLSHLAVLLNL